MSPEDSSREGHRGHHDRALVDNASVAYRRSESVDQATVGLLRDQRCSIQPLLPGPHPMHPKLYLVAGKLSAVISLTTAFHRKLQISSCLPGNKVHKSNTTCTLTNGPTFVLKGKLILCLLL